MVGNDSQEPEEDNRRVVLIRILICGDRNWTDKKVMLEFLWKLSRDTLIIEGEGRGADRIARDLAILLGFNILPFPADWKRYGKAAGPIRNQQMLDEGKPDLVVAFHNNLSKSKGTKDMVNRAKKAGIPVQVIRSGLS